MDAQAPPAAASRPAFEVASVRPNTSGSGTIRVGPQQSGRFEAINIPLAQLIQNAYRLHDFQIVGGPTWLSDRFDVIATAETAFAPVAPGTIGSAWLMLQSLLAERFQLVAHRETREMDIYALVRAREDGRLGPRLRQSDIDCEALSRPGAGRFDRHDAPVALYRAAGAAGPEAGIHTGACGRAGHRQHLEAYLGLVTFDFDFRLLTFDFRLFTFLSSHS